MKPPSPRGSAHKRPPRAFVGFGYGAASDNDYSGGDSDSAKAQVLIEKHFPEQQGDTLTLAIKAEQGINDPAVRRKIDKVVADLAASPITGPVTSPYQDEDLVTEDRRIARTTIPLIDKDVEKTEVKLLVDAVKDASGDGVTLGLGGDKAEKAEIPPQGSAESAGVLAAAVILFIAFGSLVAAGLPIATGLMAALGGIALMKIDDRCSGPAAGFPGCHRSQNQLAAPAPSARGRRCPVPGAPYPRPSAGLSWCRASHW